MVERLKIAVEKARAQRARAGQMPHESLLRPAPAAELEPLLLGSAEFPRQEPQAPPPLPLEAELTQAPLPEAELAAPADQDLRRAAAWNALEPIELSPRHLERSRIISHAKTDPAHIAFDVLRTRMLSALARKGWTRVGITSPNASCGKTFVAANLAISLARQPQSRAVLFDMDMRQPSLARVLGVKKQEALRWFLNGEIPASKFLHRVGANLALGLNSKRMRDAGELIQAPATAHALATMQAQLQPDVILYDLPPMLAGDDVMGFLPNLDCVLMVIGGGLSKPAEVTECERMLEDHCPLLGVLLNMDEGASIERYAYDY